MVKTSVLLMNKINEKEFKLLKEHEMEHKVSEYDKINSHYDICRISIL